MRNKTIYYAHSKRIYNSAREEEELKFLENTFKEVICPNRDMGELGDMDPYLKKVKKCDIVICSEHEKHIGKGVYEEVKMALDLNKDVFCLRKHKGGFILRTVTAIKITDEDDWTYFYGKLKTKLWR